MKETILIVDDDPSHARLLKDAIEERGDDATEVLIAKSIESALLICTKHIIAYCILDLELPQNDSGDLDGQEYAGFNFIEPLRKTSPHVEITILSSYAENLNAMKKRVEKFHQNVPIKWMLHKANDSEYLKVIIRDVEGLGEASKIISNLRIRIFHFLERRIVRCLWELAGRPCDHWPVPMLVITGPTRSGKDFWAFVYHRFRIHRQNLTAREPEACDLGTIGRRESGEAAKIRLFGADNFPNVIKQPGVFERATTYMAGHKPDFARSNVAMLRELGNLPFECQTLLLDVLDPNPEIGGRVIRAGATGSVALIGCPMVFTTNANLVERVVRSDRAKEGDFREDLYIRLRKQPWLVVPSPFDIGFEAFLFHLEEALFIKMGHRVDISPIAEELLKAALAERNSGVTMRMVDDIVDTFEQSQLTRLSDGHILPSLELPSLDRLSEIKSITAGAPTQQAAWTIREFITAKVVKTDSFEKEILEFLLQNVDEHCSTSDFLEKVHNGKVQFQKNSISKRAFAVSVSRLRQKVNAKASQSGFQFAPDGVGISRIRPF